MKASSRAALFVAMLLVFGGGSYLVARWMNTPDEGDPSRGGGAAPDEEDPRPSDLRPGERLEKVLPFERAERRSFPGRVHGGGFVPVRAPVGFRYPCVKILKEQGDEVKKGDILVEYYEKRLDDDIQAAKDRGADEEVKRLEAFRPSMKLRSPVDGVVLDLYAELGLLPFDEGMPVVTIADPSSFVFRADVPTGSVAKFAPLGAKVEVDIEAGVGRTGGVVAAFEEATEGQQRLVIQLDPTPGLERDLAGTLEVPVATSVVGLVPKGAVQRKGNVDVVRVWETDTKSIGERTVVLGGEHEGQWIVTAGVLAGEHVVVTERRRP
ncbi:MAG: hypothetical protein HMLKMBBP_00372 [Planctomycetes bacterium]|nr:hypothetical protein [Planctomycetota bacterium]